MRGAAPHRPGPNILPFAPRARVLWGHGGPMGGLWEAMGALGVPVGVYGGAAVGFHGQPWGLSGQPYGTALERGRKKCKNHCFHKVLGTFHPRAGSEKCKNHCFYKV